MLILHVFVLKGFLNLSNSPLNEFLKVSQVEFLKQFHGKFVKESQKGSEKKILGVIPEIIPGEVSVECLKEFLEELQEESLYRLQAESLEEFLKEFIEKF